MGLAGAMDAKPAAASQATRVWRDSLQGYPGARSGDHVVDPHRQGALNRHLLVLLVLARLTMTAAGIVAVTVLWHPTVADYPWLRIGAVLLAVGGLTYAVWVRLLRDDPPTEDVFVVHLLADIALLTFVFHQTGGIENPFLVFYMLPMTLAGYALSRSRLFGAALTVAGALALLSRYHNEVPVFNETVHEASELIAVAAITYFAFAVARLSRRHERAVSRAREDAMDVRGAQALGSVAVRAADTVSSPLATMSVLVYELQRQRLPPAEWQAALDVLAQQIGLCKSNLSTLLESVGQPRAERGARRGIDALLCAAVHECEMMDPGLRVTFERVDATPPDIVDERSLFDAFVLLIQHCGRDEPRTVRVALEWNEGTIVVALCGRIAPDSPTAGYERNAADRREADASVALAASLIGRLGGSLAWTTRNHMRCLEARLAVAAVGLAPLTPRRPAATISTEHGTPGIEGLLN